MSPSEVKNHSNLDGHVSVWLSCAVFSKLIMIYLCPQQPFSAVYCRRWKQPKYSSADDYINNVINRHRGILVNLKTEGSPVTCNNMDEPWGHHTSHTKTNIKSHIYALSDQQENVVLTNRGWSRGVRGEEISSCCLMDIDVQFRRMKSPGDLLMAVWM